MYHHKVIKRFQIKVVFKDDSDLIRTRAQYESLLTHDMKSKGYARLLDLDPGFSVSWTDGKTWEFLLTMHGIYVGRKKAWQSAGISQGKLIPRSMRPVILDPSFKA
jgi:hypothetical protein